MTNREWLMKEMQNMSDEELAEVFMGCNYFCRVQDYKPCENRKYDCKNCRINWLKSEHKEQIKLSEAEKVILENIDKDYKWIVRGKDGTLTLYSEKPTKEDACWEGYDVCDFWAYDHLFQFITWEDENPYNIEELLKGE